MTAERLLALGQGDDVAFGSLARSVFESQKAAGPTYRAFAGDVEWMGWESVPYLPVEAFKWGGVIREGGEPEVTFLSSATGGRRSRHPILDLDLCDTLAIAWFRRCFGEGPFRFVAHLPSYQKLGRESSLIHMVGCLMSAFGTVDSLFVLEEDEFREQLRGQSALSEPSVRTLVFGTAFGLLDLVRAHPIRLQSRAIVIETGGMKSRRREIDRATLHAALARGFGTDRSFVRSEYGMCEMVSQFYTQGGDTFCVPPWVRTRIVDPANPSRGVAPGRAGLLAVFDLGNANSVSPLLTSDLARDTGDGIQILGRLEGSELRGCNFLLDGDL